MSGFPYLFTFTQPCGGLPRRRGRMTRLEDRQILVRDIEQACADGRRQLMSDGECGFQFCIYLTVLIRKKDVNMIIGTYRSRNNTDNKSLSKVANVDVGSDIFLQFFLKFLVDLQRIVIHIAMRIRLLV
jgi:hypothetical protein